MSRISISAVALIFTAICLASSGAAGPPTIKLAFYAPKAFYWPDQADPPVRIIGFENRRSEISFVLANTSDKAVASVEILDVIVAPPGCASNPERESASSVQVSKPQLLRTEPPSCPRVIAIPS